eukprot:2716084-Heterocapsa_arctica.AAC.1
MVRVSPRRRRVALGCGAWFTSAAVALWEGGRPASGGRTRRGAVVRVHSFAAAARVSATASSEKLLQKGPGIAAVCGSLGFRGKKPEGRSEGA